MKSIFLCFVGISLVFAVTPSPRCPTLPCSHGCTLPNTTKMDFCNSKLHPEFRVASLLRQLTLTEKIGLVGANPNFDTCPLVDQGVPRLGIPPMMWLVETNTAAASECLAPGKCATTFMSPAGLAASFNRTVWKNKGSVISTEMRAYNNIGWYRAIDGTNENNYFIGLSGYGPNINIVRDPRYGRNCEIPSEDPFLAGTYAAHMVKGMQQGEEDPRYLKMMAFVKHYTAYSVEANRMAFNGVINDFDMWDTYLAQYKIAFIEGRASGAMCSYASINGIPSCGNPFLMNDVVRTRWERPDTLFTSDCDAVANMADANHYATNYTTAVAYAINAGMDLNTGATYTNNLGPAVAMGFTNETTITAAVRRTLMMKMRTGMFDPLESQVYTTYDERNVSSERNQFINFDTVSQSFVLLKNANNTLPLQRGQKVAVVGPHAVSTRGLLEDYAGDRICYGYPGPNYDCIQTLGEGIANLNGAITAVAEGVSVSGSDTSKIAAALAAARNADVVVLCLGLDTMSVEHEGQDRSTINLPGIQEQFAQQIFALGKPTVLVLVNGGAIAIDNLIQQSHAIVEAFYPSTSGAAALANSLFGLSNRWGKLPFTIYPNNYINQVQMNDMSMTNGAGRTYRYYSGTPLFPFGVGLSYSSFNIDPCVVHNNYHVQCNVCLVGGASTGDEVVLVYHQVSDAIRANVSRIHPVPAKQLIDFERFTFTSIGECQRATFKFKVDQFGITDSKGSKVLYPGDHNIIVTNGNDQTQVLSFTF
eukprot:PhF_6_TR37047/c0_g1_i1/m.54219/K15920/XYL4; beta-D-xylosidase 4